ncbi:MAG: cytochrome c [Thermodesulfovibrionales bacterium]
MPEKRWEAIRTDSGSINRGEALFNAHCRYCHDPYSTRMKAGPGLMGLLRNPRLPFSNRPATPENIREQLIHPVDHMPSFDHLREEEAEDLLSFLNTL